MRAERIGLWTWLLAGAAIWALLVWIVMVAGAGRTLPKSTVAPVDAPAVPVLPAAPLPAVGALQGYTELTERPLFSADRRPRVFLLGSEAEQSGVLRLSGVLMVPGFHMATLTTASGQSLRLREGGEAVGGWQLLALHPRSATLLGPEGTFELELQVASAGKDVAGSTEPAVAANAPAQAGSGPSPSSPASEVAAPEVTASATQLQSIRERIQARRKQQQEQQNKPPPSKPVE